MFKADYNDDLDILRVLLAGLSFTVLLSPFSVRSPPTTFLRHAYRQALRWMSLTDRLVVVPLSYILPAGELGIGDVDAQRDLQPL